MAKEREQAPKALWAGLQWPKVVLVMAILAGYVYFLDILGFSLSAFLLIFLLLKAVKPTQWWIAIMAGVIAVLISYALFKVWLEFPSPAGF